MKISILIILAVCLTLSLNAQTTAVTAKGDTILVYDNGTWKPVRTAVATAELIGSVSATVEVDEFNKSKKIQTESWTRFAENTLRNYISGSMLKVNDITVMLLSYSGDLGCLSEYNSTLKVKLTNGEIIEFSQISDTDCGDFPSANFIPITREQQKDPNFQEILEENLKLLANYDWETIRLNGSEYYTDLVPRTSNKISNPEQFFRQHLSAINSK